MFKVSKNKNQKNTSLLRIIILLSIHNDKIVKNKKKICFTSPFGRSKLLNYWMILFSFRSLLYIFNPICKYDNTKQNFYLANTIITILYWFCPFKGICRSNAILVSIDKTVKNVTRRNTGFSIAPKILPCVFSSTISMMRSEAIFRGFKNWKKR